MKETHAPQSERQYRRILGIRFFVGDAPEAVDLGMRPGLVVVPAAPAVVELSRDREYRRAVLESDLAITDSGYLVLLWNLLKRDRIHRVSGLEYLKLLLAQPELHEPGAVLWIMPSQESIDRNVEWLRSQGFPTRPEDCYLAPHYPPGPIADDTLRRLVENRAPRHIIVALGGGVQEKLGLYLKRQCSVKSAIHCIGAAIGFLSGDQVKIPHWADQWFLGWFFRCASNPKRFLPRYARAVRLASVLWKYHERMPELVRSPSLRLRPYRTPLLQVKQVRGMDA